MPVHEPIPERRGPEAKAADGAPLEKGAERSTGRYALEDVPALGGATAEQKDSLDAALGRLRGAVGAPLPGNLSRSFEQSLGGGVGDVRVHTGAADAAASAQMNARAFTVGRDVHFGAGQYRPGTPEGDQLIAHEVVHTAQQQGAAPALQPKLRVGPAGGAAEREADSLASTLLSGQPADVRTRADTSVQRALADAPQSERRGMEMRPEHFVLTAADVTPYFERLQSGGWGTRVPAPGGATVTLGSGIPPALLVPMTSIAGHLAGSVNVQRLGPGGGQERALAPGRTLVASAPLAQHGVADGEYRFSWSGAGANGRGGTVAIELISGARAPTQSQATEAGGQGAAASAQREIRVRTLHFPLGATGWDAQRVASLREALSITPFAALQGVDGLRFEYRTGPSGSNEGGHYDGNGATPTVTMYARAWGAAQGPGRGPGRSGGDMQTADPVRAIAHEIGHAIDNAPLRRASQTYGASQGTGADNRTLGGARSESGYRYTRSGQNGPWQETEARTRQRDGAFRQACVRDGAAVRRGTGGAPATLSGGVTDYGNTDWGELYAESFALYTRDPAALQLLRPTVYQYFLDRFPRQAAAPASGTNP